MIYSYPLHKIRDSLLLAAISLFTIFASALGCGVLKSTWSERLANNGDGLEYLQLAELITGRNHQIAKETVLLRPPLYPAFLSYHFGLDPMDLCSYKFSPAWRPCCLSRSAYRS